MELISQRSKTKHLTVATVIGFILFMVATIQLPAELGRGRDLLVGLFQIAVLIAFFSVLWKINKFVALFLVLAVISRTVPTITYESQAALKMVLFGLGWYYIVYTYGDKNLLMDVICVIAFVHFMATTVQFFKIPSIWAGSVSGLTCNPNEGSAMFALCFPAFLREGRKRYLPIIFAGLVMIGSFGGTVAVGVGFIFYSCMLGYWLIIIPVIVGLGTFWWCVDAPSAGARWTVWGNAFNMYLPHWKWGCGLGHWETISRELARANIQLLPGNSLAWTRLHNTFLNGLIEMGVGFAVIVSGYLIDTVRKYTKKAIVPFTALIVIIVCCSTNSIFRMNAVNGMIAITWLAILQIELRSEKCYL